MDSKQKFIRLQKKLNILYSVSTALVLTAFLLTAFLLNFSNTNSLIRDNFKSNISTIDGKVISENYVSDKWIYDYEKSNNLMIFIFDNGNPLFHNSIFKNTVRADVFDKADNLLKDKGINLLSAPISLKRIQSDCYIMPYKNKKYLVSAENCQVKNSYCSFLVLRECPELTSQLYFNIIIYILIDLVGISVLSLLGKMLIKKLLEPLIEGENRQSEFIASVSHELKTPLAVICAQNSCSDTTNSRKIINDECKRMSSLIEDMLYLAFYKTDRWSVKKENVNIELALTEVYEKFMSVAGRKNTKITISLPDDELPLVSGDYQRIIQALSAIVDNSISYSPDGKSIDISAQSTKNTVILNISDHGNGISDEDKQRIFEKFYRSEKSRTDNNHFGLGLNIAKELINRMGGDISVSDTKGGGATFSVSLKAVKSSSPAPLPQ